MTVENYPERDDLFWHALNYRCAAGQHAEEQWQELVACHERLVAAAVAKNAPRWTPMDEALPPIKTPVMVLAADGSVCVASFEYEPERNWMWWDVVGVEGGEGFSWDDPRQKWRGIEAWMALPGGGA